MPNKHTPKSSNNSLSYEQLWKGLTNYAIKPAFAQHVKQSKKLHSDISKSKQRGGRKIISDESRQNEFISEWTQSIKKVVAKKQKQHNLTIKQYKNSRGNKTGKQRGGYIRSGSTHYLGQFINNGCYQ